MLAWLAVALYTGAGAGSAFRGTLQLCSLAGILLRAALLFIVVFGLLDQDIEQVLVVGLEQYCLVPMSFFLGSLPRVLQRSLRSSEISMTVLGVQVEQDALRLVLQLGCFDLCTLRLMRMLAVLGGRCPRQLGLRVRTAIYLLLKLFCLSAFGLQMTQLRLGRHSVAEVL